MPVSLYQVRHTFSLERYINIFQHPHRIRSPALLLGVKQDIPLLRDASPDHVKEHRAEGLLHIRADPDEEPVVELHGGGEDGTDTGARADGNAATEEVSEVRETGELWSLESAR